MKISDVLLKIANSCALLYTGNNVQNELEKTFFSKKIKKHHQQQVQQIELCL